KGTVYLQRYVKDRPTTAVFVGQGRVTIDVPVHSERQGLWAVTKDSTVDQPVEVVAIRMADDLDLRLRERFQFEPAVIDFRVVNKLGQGEFFFKPVIMHTYDNYFRLAASIYERGPDGFFYADFNRYTFTFDPNWPEQVQIGYEVEGGDQVSTVGASFQRREAGRYDDSLLSQIAYQTTALRRTAEVRLSGTDGRRIEQAKATLDLAVNADSLRFTWLFLKYSLDVDSVLVGDERIDYVRRKTFDYTGIILPRYYHQGDTLSLTVWYRGTNFDHFLPYLSNPVPSPTEVTFNVPKGYNYYTAGMSEPVDVGGGRQEFTSALPAPLGELYFHCFPTGVEDTVQVISDVGVALNFVIADRDLRRDPCYIPRDQYQEAVTAAFNYLSKNFGPPPQTFAEYVISTGFQSAPGMIKVPQVACVTSDPWQVVGGFDGPVGNSVAHQWFGPLMRPQSGREDWLSWALPAYQGLRFIESHRSSAPYFSNLLTRRDSLYTQIQMGHEIPLSAGYRVNDYWDANGKFDFYRTILNNKGVWLLHMLRFLMYDYEAGSDAKFAGFSRELFLQITNRTFSNADFVRLAEKHYGAPLDWFFRQWLYGAYLPEYNATWTKVQRDGSWYVAVTVQTGKVPPSFQMPVIVRVVEGDGRDAFSRPVITAPSAEFELGPFSQEPRDFVFNEFLSTLGWETVSRK
ncbi:MAG TPA: hypothetical protein PKY95_06025, partial [candidate division Zixibacteria bacterium]|nr:hypothetical protein [candidate division Zixibacteria bacterium]